AVAEENWRDSIYHKVFAIHSGRTGRAHRRCSRRCASDRQESPEEESRRHVLGRDEAESRSRKAVRKVREAGRQRQGESRSCCRKHAAPHATATSKAEPVEPLPGLFRNPSRKLEPLV